MNLIFRIKLVSLLFIGLCQFPAFSQIHVQTIVRNINASGGLAIDSLGNLYVSDFGSSFQDTSKTKVYKVTNDTWEVSVFGGGFAGASGVYIDEIGLYQSNPKSNSISRILPDGQVEHDFIENLKLPVGIARDESGNYYVCNCRDNSITKFDSEGNSYVWIKNEKLLKCPNGMTYHDGNLFIVNFNSDKLVKIDVQEGSMSVLSDEFDLLIGGPQPVGLGHITYSNGYLFTTGIGRGFIYRVSLNGKVDIIAGDGQFKNTDGEASKASFSKPNGIVASLTGDTLFVNVSKPSWVQNPGALHPAHLVMITGICSLPNSNCE
ncbi:MAG: hypothetical protein ACFHWX_09535 [Bacteroidota bacterium]